MADQPEALRLADVLDHVELRPSDYKDVDKAAAELRRLHALNGELLEALKSTHALLQAALFIVSDAEARAIARQQLDVNRAAIARAEGEKG